MRNHTDQLSPQDVWNKLFTTDSRKGRCSCGCGARTKTNKRTGERRDYIHGHQSHARIPAEPPILVDPKTGCWLWQRSTAHGYAVVTGSSGSRGHRIFYRAVFGDLPSSVHLDHLCRVRRCVNPYHLEPVSNAENNRRGARAKLTPALVDEIKEMVERVGYGGRQAAAEKYGVDPAHVSRIVRGHRWGEIGALAQGAELPKHSRPRLLTDDKREEICRRVNEGETQTAVARSFGVNSGTVSRIVRGIYGKK